MRPGWVWTGFGLCAVVVFLAMGWSSTLVLRLEGVEQAAQASADLEEDTRLALWRLDSAVTPLLVRESARPYFHYGAYFPVGGAYGRMFSGVAGEDVVPSPLLREAPPRVLLHFQIGPGGTVTSPQVPPPALRGRSFRDGADPRQVARYDEQLGALRSRVRGEALWAEVSRQEKVRVAEAQTSKLSAEALPLQKRKSANEFNARQQTVQQNVAPLVVQDAGPSRAEARPKTGPVIEGEFSPLWVGGDLMLVRQVTVDGVRYIQGCWLDWPALQSELLASVRDLLPDARLEPANGDADDTRRLATLPVRLAVGGYVPRLGARLSLVQLSLAGAWAGLVVATLAVGGLLAGVMALSERRRLFVSAVTHELRTPLTTFRLYTDMMASGMVGEDRRREYLERLRAEAQRLGHLVENVLFYARLEGGRAGAVREAFDLRALVVEAVERLQPRGRDAGLTLAVAGEAGAPLTVRADRSAVEQILVNLIDNACKFAAKADPPRVDLTLAQDAGFAVLQVRDYGPGLSARDRKRLFRPFSKSDREAAVSAPGVGLGLALSRRLARAQGGDLRPVEVRPGAAFALRLTLAAREG